ncbi:MAG TPA: FGGY family carbohydrate kinase [Candidatus Limnocylindria bacterium]|nr:FGGY family carbohydrate kinase [Candidatus Limnocylindria bacterium]
MDQGTSGTKAVVVAPGRGVIGSAEVALRPDFGAAGAVEQDPHALLTSVLEAGRAAVNAAGEPVAAVGLANQGETVLVWDRSTGAPLSPMVVWQDRRSADLCSRLSAHSDELAAITGLSLDPYFAAPKMAWLREQGHAGGVVTTSDAWLIHQLCGAFVTDASTASRTLILDLDSASWSPRALEIFGLAEEELPEVVACAGSFGETSAFGPDLPLAGLVVDQQAALFAQGCLQPGQAKCTYGTGAFLLANVGAGATRSHTGLPTSVAWQTREGTSYCLDGQVYTVASAVRWLVDLGVLAGADDLDRLGGTVADAGEVTFVPSLAGLGAPWWAPQAKGSLTGLGLDTTGGHLVHALCEGIAAQVADLAAAMAADLGAPLTTLSVDGGLTRSTLLMQTQADLLQVPVEVFASPDATALGAAAFAHLGFDSQLALADAVEPWRPAATYEPRIGADEAAERLDRHRVAVAAVVASRGVGAG